MRDRIRGPVVSLVALAAFLPGAAPAIADPTAERAGAIGIQLLEAPAARQKDPRAQQYIVDHLRPGTTIHRRFRVLNDTPVPRPVQVYAGAAAVEHNEFAFADGRARNELTGWVSFDRNTVDVPARGDGTVTVTIAVPAAASKGERYGVIWAEAASSSGPGLVAMVSRVGLRIYLDVGPGWEPASDFRIEELLPARAADGRAEVVGRVRNTGERALDIAGSLDLPDGPGSLRAGPYPVESAATLAPGQAGQVRVRLDAGMPNGPWTARLTLSSGLVERAVTVPLTFPDISTVGTVGAVGAPVKPLTRRTFVYGWLAGGVFAVLAIAAYVAVLARRSRGGKRQGGETPA